MRRRCLPLVFCALLGGCQRRLPGPDECRAFALASLGVEPGTPATALEQQPEITARVEKVTRECLTVPWDRKLLDCLAQGQSSRVCALGFEQRRLGAE